MFGGGVGSFSYSALGGLETVSNATSSGWEHIRVRPSPAAIARLGHGQASMATRFGLAATSWEWRDGALDLAATIPSGASASVFFPAVVAASSSSTCRLSTVSEAGHACWKGGEFVPGAVPGVSGAIVEAQAGGKESVVLSTGSGAFAFNASYAAC